MGPCRDHAPPADLHDYDSPVESRSVSPSEVIHPGDERPGETEFVDAPTDGPPFQFYCLLLTLSFDDAVDFEFVCRHHLGVQHGEVPWGDGFPFCMVLFC